MKRILSLFLVTLMIIACFVGCKQNPVHDVSSVASQLENAINNDFVKPSNYASVVVVTINPQFKLYLDANGVVLAVESVNNDAKSIESKISFENKKVEEVVNNLIVAANDSGFVKTNATIEIKITEVVDKAVDTTEILNKITTSTNDKLTELKIEAEVTTAVELVTEEPTESEVNDSSITSNVESTVTEKPVCKHTQVSVKSASTGSNIIDSSKLDVVNHIKSCADCGETLGTEKHTVKDGKCTVCGQSNLATTQVSLRDAGISGGPSGHTGAEVSNDGTPDFDYMAQEGYFAIGYDELQKYLNDKTDNWYFEIPESVYYDALKTKFVMSDSLFAKFKAQGKYEFFWCEHTYSNGYFYIPYMAVGDVASFTHNVMGYKDNNGTFTVYYDYLEGGPDIEEAERVHQFYYVIEFAYSGASNLEVIKNVENDYTSYFINGWTPVVNSLRIKSIKKVTDVSGITGLK